HHWRFDETGTMVTDSAGAAQGLKGRAVSRIAGVVGSGALRFFGPNGASSVDLGAAVDNFGTGDFTITFWFRTTDTRNQQRVGDRIDGGNGNWITLRVSSGAAVFEPDEVGGNNHGRLESAPIYADCQWDHS